jgi:uncharacterized membrane protein YsdA (DUF1294 family)
MEILIGLAMLVGNIITLGLAFIVLRWLFKWLGRTVRFVAIIIVLLLLNQLVLLTVLYPLLNTYIQIANAGKSHITLITLIAGCLVIVHLLLPIQKADELANAFHGQVKLAKKSLSEDQLRLYQGKEADKKAWLFSLYSIIAFLIFFLLQILTINLVYPFFSNHFKNSLPDNIFVAIFIGIIGLIMFLIVNNHNKQDRAFSSFRYYGKWLITLNFSAIALAAFFLYEEYAQSLSTPGQTNLYLNHLPGLSAFFITTIYFHCVNISAFFTYGYDSGVAWLFPKNDAPTHWVQKLFGWINSQNPRIKENMMQRMPESILHWHSTCGGTIGAFMGHKFFIHKMRGAESRVKFAPIFKRTVIVQILLIIAILSLQQTR